MADDARVLLHPDEFPFVGPAGPHEDGTIVVNEESGETYFWNVQATPAPKWEALQ